MTAGQLHGSSGSPDDVRAPSTPLLLTKILAPPRREVIPRQRLSDRLDQQPPGTVALLVAPAGSGKTTLLASWIATLPPERASRVAWLALDEGDSDPQRLLRYLIAALARVDVTIGASALALLDAPQASLQTALTLLLNDLALLREPVALVLDDYHLIQIPALHRALVFLVEHLPPTLRLVIATREDPPLPLSRLRARSLIIELHGDNLRFRDDEAAALLNGTLRLALSNDDVTALVDRTEGWGVGLQIAGLALRDRADPQAFIASFTGSHRLVLDYLSDEVLERLPVHLERFLLQTSILERLTGPLCDAVLDLGGGEPAAYSQLLLDEVERLNLFLVPLDDERTWFRYHHLFHTVLRERLRRGAAPELIAALHGRAARWYTGNAMPIEAARHAIAGGHWSQAADVLVESGERLLHGAADTFAELVGALPERLRNERPQLWYLLGAHARHRWDYRAVLQLLQCALRGFAACGDDVGRGRCLTYLADAYRIAGEPDRAVAALREALATPLPPGVRAVALMASAVQLQAGGSWREAAEAVDQALQLAEAMGDRAVCYELAVSYRSLLVTPPGGVERAARFSRLLRDQVEVPESPLQAQAHFLDGLAHVIRGEPAAASDQLGRALALDERFGRLAWLSIDAQIWWVNCAVLVGDLDAAERRFARLSQALEQPHFAGFRSVWGAAVAALQARVLWLQGRVDALRDLAAQIPPRPLPGEWPVASLGRTLVQALLALVEGRSDDAEKLLLQLIPLQQQRPDAAPLGDARLILAHLYQRQGRTPEALASLDAALAAHKAEGTVGVAMLTGAPVVVPLLRLALAHGVRFSLAERLLRALGPAADAIVQGVEAPEARHEAGGAPATADPDALTPRELEVLQQIAAGATNPEIAARLVLSIATVKKHVHNIFAKLDAKSRTQALVRARERRFL